MWVVDSGKCLLTLANTAAAPAAVAAAAPAEATVTAILPSPPQVRAARLAVSRCGRLVAFGSGKQIKVLDLDRLADRSEAAGRPGQSGAYLAQALRFVVSPTT